MFAKYCLAEEIVSDNGPQFTSYEFIKFLRSNRVKYTYARFLNVNCSVQRFGYIICFVNVHNMI